MSGWLSITLSRSKTSSEKKIPSLTRCLSGTMTQTASKVLASTEWLQAPTARRRLGRSCWPASITPVSLRRSGWVSRRCRWAFSSSKLEAAAGSCSTRMTTRQAQEGLCKRAAALRAASNLLAVGMTSWDPADSSGQGQHLHGSSGWQALLDLSLRSIAGYQQLPCVGSCRALRAGSG